MLPVVILSVVPLMRGIYLAFTDARAGLDVETDFIGLDNFRELLHDDLFVNSFKIGLIWSVSVTAIQFVLALGLALLLSQNIRGRWLARSLALVPWAMPSVIVAIMWKLFFQPQAGILNELLRRAHLPGADIDWLSNFSWALPAVILVGVWAGMPQTTIALLAGLQSIRDDLHEAAAVDGATGAQRFLRVTLPAISPIMLLQLVLQLTTALQTFNQPKILTQNVSGGAGGPEFATNVLMLSIYEDAFGGLGTFPRLGYASAQVWVLFTGIVLVVALSARILSRWTLGDRDVT